jgi:hypothetical protein
LRIAFLRFSVLNQQSLKISTPATVRTQSFLTRFRAGPK